MPHDPDGRSGRLFADREDAGRQLGERLVELEWDEPLVLGLARGGVPVAAEVARRLDAELGLAVARKIGAPGNPELAIAAVASDGTAVYEQHSLSRLGLTEASLADAVRRERAAAAEALRTFGRDCSVCQRQVVVVDDGIATGLTARAALHALRAHGPTLLVLTAPVAAPDAVRTVHDCCDEVYALDQPADFGAVARYYDRFEQVSDEYVRDLLTQHR